MTGFGKGEDESEGWRVRVYAKSVNGKSLEVFIKSNLDLTPIEIPLRNKVKERIRRGTITLRVEVEPKKVDYIIDTQKIRENLSLVKSLSQELSLNVSDDVLFQISWRYAEKRSEEIDQELQGGIERALESALEELIRSRREEGKVLEKDIKERLRKIEEISNRILQGRERIYEGLKSRVLERAKELGLSESHPTILNEITFLLSKVDVEEEITRFKAHLERAWDVLRSQEEVGRRLDFILQEMYREINTLGNKIPELSQYVVEIKAEIDRLKQQSANVE